jgi:hypothetical protein
LSELRLSDAQRLTPNAGPGTTRIQQLLGHRLLEYRMQAQLQIIRYSDDLVYGLLMPKYSGTLFYAQSTRFSNPAILVCAFGTNDTLTQ